jgi:glycerol dehydrogenase-like iron-containing ADH family enzyme
MSRAESNIMIGLALGIAGLLLLSNPRCPRGCRTVAEHLITHGLEDLIAGLFA